MIMKIIEVLSFAAILICVFFLTLNNKMRESTYKILFAKSEWLHKTKMCYVIVDCCHFN